MSPSSLDRSNPIGTCLGRQEIEISYTTGIQANECAKLNLENVISWWDSNIGHCWAQKQVFLFLESHRLDDGSGVILLLSVC